MINNTWRLAPWADALYACDAKWWEQERPQPEEFRGLRIIGKDDFPGCHSANVQAVSHMIWTGEAIGGGGNSGFQALNLAALWGARRVLYLGLDCQGSHWHGDHTGALKNPRGNTILQWLRCFEGAAPDLARRGVEVINCSRETAVTAFRRANIEDVL